MKKANCLLLLIDDEAEFVQSVQLAIALQEPEWRVLVAQDGAQGLFQLAEARPDLLLLALPDLHGYDVLKEIRLISSVPVILLSTCGEELAKVHGLELGADDYVVKPCGYFELLARIRALLRRGEGQAAPFEHPYVTGALRVDFARRGVTVDGQPVQLTGTEYRLLEVLARNAGRIVPYDRLLQRVWGDEGAEGPAFLKVFVYRLRRKIEPDPAHPRYLLTERGCGYWLSPAAESFRGSEQKGL